MGSDVLRQAEEIAERAALSHELAERKIAERMPGRFMMFGLSWRC